MKDPKEVLENTVKRCREQNIIIPTYGQLVNPDKIPHGIKLELKDIGLWDVHPRNLFRITWHNEPVKHGGGFGKVNFMEIPKEITGVEARIITLVGKYFPTGAHKVGAAFGCLVPKLITGQFDPTTQKALWPSTGNYCRGGAYDSTLLGCRPIAVLPEGMSKERFEWMEKLGTEIHATPGTEANVKEVFDKTNELKRTRKDEIVVLNQFDEIGNSIWHYVCTGKAMEEVFNEIKMPRQRLSGVFLTQGSAGTLGSGNYLRERFPRVKVCAGEAIQVPTMLYTGYGDHRIEGIGDKHIPWIMDVRNLDMVAGINDEYCMRLIRLFNEDAGRKHLESQGIPADFIAKLDLMGISSVANMLGAIKMAKFYEMDADDVIITVATDSMEMYQSRLRELTAERGEYTAVQAAQDLDTCLRNINIDGLHELGYWDRKRVHNLKYFTWVEQQGKTVEELNRQWHDRDYWYDSFHSYEEWDEKIMEFNERTGLLASY